MTDEARQPEEQPRHVESTGLGSAETLIGLGAAILVVDWLLFGIILDGYYFFTGTLLVAGYALFALWVRTSRPSTSWPVSYPWLMKVLGYTAGALGLVELLGDLRYGVLDTFGYILGGVITYVGAFLMFWGARQVNS
jgi:hypothetical protein